MAQVICRRQVKSMDAAARAALKEHGPSVGIRQLTRVYAPQRRELEMAAMRETAFFPWGPFRDWPALRPWAAIPARWQELTLQAEELAKEDPEFARLATEVVPGVPIHRLTPAELAELFELAGVAPKPPAE